jgi:hypothetical protein
MPTSKAQKRDTRSEYDFSQGVRGKYAARFAQRSNVVVLAPDVAEVFTSSQAVNEALRAQLAKAPRKPRSAARATKPGRARR